MTSHLLIAKAPRLVAFFSRQPLLSQQEQRERSYREWLRLERRLRGRSHVRALWDWLKRTLRRLVTETKS